MATEISYQMHDLTTDTTGVRTFTVEQAVDSISDATRAAEAHAAEQAGPDAVVDVNVIATADGAGRDLVAEWENTYADEL